jgi:hypothetical protein
MAGNSFLLKGWSVTLVSALFALAAAGANIRFVFLAYLPALGFWVLDGYFLHQEWLFRGLYDQVRGQNDTDFSMKTAAIKGKGWVSAWHSKTLLWFHGAVLTAISTTLLTIAASR